MNDTCHRIPWPTSPLPPVTSTIGAIPTRIWGDLRSVFFFSRDYCGRISRSLDGTGLQCSIRKHGWGSSGRQEETACGRARQGLGEDAGPRAQTCDGAPRGRA